MNTPSRGQIWQVVFKHAGVFQTQPSLILSDDLFNQNSANLVIILSITDKQVKTRSHIQVSHVESQGFFICCEEILTVSRDRCTKHLANVSDKIMKEVDETVKLLLGF